MTTTYTSERVIRVWDDAHGERIEVGTDSDGLDIAEIRAVLADGKIHARISGAPEQMVMVARAILELYDTAPKAVGDA